MLGARRATHTRTPGAPAASHLAAPPHPGELKYIPGAPPQETDSGVMTESLTSASPGGLRNSCVVLQHT